MRKHTLSPRAFILYPLGYFHVSLIRIGIMSLPIYTLSCVCTQRGYTFDHPFARTIHIAIKDTILWCDPISISLFCKYTLCLECAGLRWIYLEANLTLIYRLCSSTRWLPKELMDTGTACCWTTKGLHRIVLQNETDSHGLVGIPSSPKYVCHCILLCSIIHML